MGLDMYLHAERYFWDTEVPPNTPGVPAPYRIKTITVDVASWRKANWIHRWFVQNAQDGRDDCQRYFVSREQLGLLRDLCQHVLVTNSYEDLPTTPGFFFGAVDLKDPGVVGYYRETLEYTIERIEQAVKALPPKDWDFYYESSW